MYTKMWKILLVIAAIALAFYVIHKNQTKKKLRDKTGELVETEDVRDIFGHDLLDREAARVMRLS
jgi:hypothetical protein